jgi:hypothetical protein
VQWCKMTFVPGGPVVKFVRIWPDCFGTTILVAAAIMDHSKGVTFPFQGQEDSGMSKVGNALKGVVKIPVVAKAASFGNDDEDKTCRIGSSFWTGKMSYESVLSLCVRKLTTGARLREKI